MTVAVECLRLSQPRLVPDGWNQDALQQFASRWQTIRTPEGKIYGLRWTQARHNIPHLLLQKLSQTHQFQLRNRQRTGEKQLTQPTQWCDQKLLYFNLQSTSLFKSGILSPRQFRKLPNRIVMSTSGAQYDRCKQATQKELQAFLKTAWKEPTGNSRIAFTILRQ